MDSGTLKIGQKVEVIPISEEQKEYYPWGWVDEMDKYIGEILTISGYVNEEYPVIDEEAWGHRGNPGPHWPGPKPHPQPHGRLAASQPPSRIHECAGPYPRGQS